MSTESTTHELVRLPGGSFTIKPRAASEAMHSAIGPWEEARLLYVEQSRLGERLTGARSPVVVYDVGMGIAANALAAAECFWDGGTGAGLHVVSFENALGGLRFALAHGEKFPFLWRHRSGVERLLRERVWRERGLCWELREGDFMATELEALPVADLVFFDFYSPKADPGLWSAACFEKLRGASGPTAMLLTYAAATSARAAMLLAGFHVGGGVSTGAKRETTIATARLEDLQRPLGSRWLEKLARSSKPLPIDWDSSRRPEAMARIQSCPQFVDCGKSVEGVGKSWQFK